MTTAYIAYIWESVRTKASEELPLPIVYGLFSIPWYAAVGSRVVQAYPDGEHWEKL